MGANFHTADPHLVNVTGQRLSRVNAATLGTGAACCRANCFLCKHFKIFIYYHVLNKNIQEENLKLEEPQNMYLMLIVLHRKGFISEAPSAW